MTPIHYPMPNPSIPQPVVSCLRTTAALAENPFCSSSIVIGPWSLVGGIGEGEAVGLIGAWSLVVGPWSLVMGSGSWGEGAVASFCSFSRKGQGRRGLARVGFFQNHRKSRSAWRLLLPPCARTPLRFACYAKTLHAQGRRGREGSCGLGSFCGMDATRGWMASFGEEPRRGRRGFDWRREKRAWGKVASIFR